ncbi:hypothetical protein [Brevundimonas sp.]|uniref:hypothetical protein n=1 Tax=Brevundimonas sp. TaxID=1871086 RepID=UPI0025EF596C|nr:hypothetical protein [Brevundimonas sp.]
MKTLISCALAAGSLAIAGAASAQSCEALARLDDFGSLAFGTRLAALPDGFSVVDHCASGVSEAECVLQDERGVTYSLYDGYILSKYVEVGAAPLPWDFSEGADRARAARLLSAVTQQSATGVLSPDNQLHVRSQFACGDAWGQAFARYSGNRLVAVGIETAL